MKTMILIVPCLADRVDETQWACSTPAGGPAGLSGLQGLGVTVQDARKALAEAIALAVAAKLVENVDPADVEAIRLLMTTRKTFSYTEVLDSATASW
jgi:hypothetical protein